MSKVMYSQIVENIETYIALEQLKPKDKLPSERELSEKWNVSRMTVRNAIVKLIDDGILYSVRGSGTFIAPKKIVLNLGEASSFKETMKREKLKYDTTVLYMNKIEANKELAKTFEVQLGNEFWAIKRRREVEGIPFSVETSYIPYENFIGINQYDFSTESLFEILKVVYNIEIVNQKHYIHTAPLSEEDLKQLDLMEGSMVIYLTNHALDKNGKIAVYTKEWVRPDRCIITSISKEKSE